jgi:uroporphyrin-III C-methyltransferase/precorrin-2 dehydrogenase/sirohydrochlorin ferrochelatase
LKDGSIDLNWSQLAQPSQTLVFYMGLHGLPVICEQLIAHGVRADMPAALVEQGTTQQQRVYTGTLNNLPEIVEREQPKPPTLIIVGEVVELHDKLAWFKAPAHSDQGATSPIEPGSEL